MIRLLLLAAFSNNRLHRALSYPNYSRAFILSSLLSGIDLKSTTLSRAPFLTKSLSASTISGSSRGEIRMMASAASVTPTSSTIMKCKQEDISYINSSAAKAIDEMLMTVPGFSIDQLMELAGLSVACATHEFVASNVRSKPATASSSSDKINVLILAGPGNNGGDGLVAARHLRHFGYSPTVVYPKRSAGQLFTNLVKQCEDLGIPVLPAVPENAAAGFGGFDIIIDALFGFSFSGAPREPFASMIANMASSAVPVLSVDVPSGWHVEDGDVHNTGFNPAAVISLTVPKLCMKGFRGRHYVGGR
jgi:hydroxyethylthiazole kinase-like uncharacterized protein yjeF